MTAIAQSPPASHPEFRHAIAAGHRHLFADVRKPSQQGGDQAADRVNVLVQNVTEPDAGQLLELRDAKQTVEQHRSIRFQAAVADRDVAGEGRTIFNAANQRLQ